MSKRWKSGGALASRMALCGVVALGSLLGCSSEDRGLSVGVYFPCNQYSRQAGISPFNSPVSFVEVCLNYSQQDLDPDCTVSSLSSGNVDFPNVKLGKPLRVSVEGRATRDRGTPVAYGQTAPVVATEGDLKSVELQVGLVDRFGTATDRSSPSGATGKCSTMMVGRKDFTATVLADGRVLIAGGKDAAGTVLDNAEIYDPTNGTFSWVSSRLKFARAGHAAVRLGANYGYRVLLLGGEGEQQWRIAEYYDPGKNSFFALQSAMVDPRIDFTATRLNEGRVLLAGGWNGEGNKEYLATMEIFDPAREDFQPVTGNLAEGRAYHTATLTTVGRGATGTSQVLVAGGLRRQTVLSSADVVVIQDGALDAQVTNLQMSAARWGHAAARVGLGDKVVIVGGSNSSGGGGIGVLKTMELFSGFGAPRFVEWPPLDTPILETGRWALTVTELEAPPRSGGVTTRGLAVIGGLDGATNSVSQVEVLVPDNPEDPTTFLVDGTPDRMIADSRYAHRAVRLPSGKVLVLGGIYRDNVGGVVDVLKTAEIYEPGPSYWCGAQSCP